MMKGDEKECLIVFSEGNLVLRLPECASRRASEQQPVGAVVRLACVSASIVPSVQSLLPRLLPGRARLEPRARLRR